MEKNKVDIKENYIYRLDNELLTILLRDKSSGKNIIWATDNYSSRGSGYRSYDHITVKAITGYHGSREPRNPKKSKQTASVIKRRCSPLLGSATNRIISSITHGLVRTLCSTRKPKRHGWQLPSPLYFLLQQARHGKIILTMFGWRLPAAKLRTLSAVTIPSADI